MISAIVLVRPRLRADQLARTLSALVPAAVEGLVSQALLAGETIGAAERVVADHAGCDVVLGTGEADAVQRALIHAARPLVLVLLAGSLPLSDLLGEVGLLAREEAIDHVLFLRDDPPTLAARLLGRRAEILGILASRARLLAVPHPDFGTLSRIRPSRNLAARARRVP